MGKRGQGEGSISKLQNGTYCGRLTVGYDDNGKQKRKAFYGKTKKEVQEKMNAAKVDIDRQIYVEPSRMTFGNWLDNWLEEYKKRTVKPSTYYSNYDRPVKMFIRPTLGKIKLRDLNTTNIQKFINDLSDKGLKASFILRIFECLDSALRQATINELVSKNVASGVIMPKDEQEEMRVLSVEEQERFIDVARKMPSGDMFIFMLATGLRVGEVRALTWTDIDFDKATLSVNKTFSYYHVLDEKKVYCTINAPKTKAGNRIVPLIPEALTILKEKKNGSDLCSGLIFIEEGKIIQGIERIESGLIFLDEGKILPCKSLIRLRFKRILNEAGIDDSVHPHTLRHTFATRGLENGIEIVVMKEILGHSNISMTADTYTHVLQNKKRDSIMKLADTIPI